jgi:hypothetical protein
MKSVIINFKIFHFDICISSLLSVGLMKCRDLECRDNIPNSRIYIYKESEFKESTNKLYVIKLSKYI